VTRTIVVGDIHGCLEEFDELLALVSYKRGADRLVLLGDLLDRGPDGVGVVRRVQEIGAECVLGNHDCKHIRWRRHETLRIATGKKNPMKHMSEAMRRENEALSDTDLAWLKGLPRVLKLAPNWVAVHGGFEPGVPISAQDDDRLIRMRFIDETTLKSANLTDDYDQPPNSVFWACRWTGPDSVVYGHAVHGLKPLKTLGFDDYEHQPVHTLGIDTGCCFGGRLTACVFAPDFRTWEFVQVPAKRIYYVSHDGTKTTDGSSFP
jgi:bis(5'-nucleosyl)-tetraphosphatase (symmetrical)